LSCEVVSRQVVKNNLNPYGERAISNKPIYNIA